MNGKYKTDSTTLTYTNKKIETKYSVKVQFSFLCVILI